MTNLDKSIREGHYAQKQIHSRARLIAWSHQRRFSTALMLARAFAGQRVLDYGCGDGTFLAMLMGQAAVPALAVGAEIHPDLIEDCRRRFAAQGGLQFADVDELRGLRGENGFDAVFCMEVFEHVMDMRPLFDEFERLLAPGGTLVVSVPIETGLPLIPKQIVRRLAGWRGIGHYPGTTGYTAGELVSSLFAGSTQHIVRPVFVGNDGAPFHDHKGFNWKVVRGAFAARFDLVRTLTSPVSWFGPQLSTQIWFIGRKKRSATVKES
jgi:SAM-dependent methyltransferase